MKNWKVCLHSIVAAALSVCLAGCPANTPSMGPVTDTIVKDEHAHDHAHHGPHGGHIVEIGEEEYHAEWTHEENGKVTFYILDAEVKKEVPIAAEELVIEVKIGMNEPTTVKLPAVNPQDGKASTFEVVDKQLLGVLETLKAEGVVATIKQLTINGKTFENVRIKEHEHGH